MVYCVETGSFLDVYRENRCHVLAGRNRLHTFCVPCRHMHSKMEMENLTTLVDLISRCSKLKNRLLSPQKENVIFYFCLM